MPDERIDGRRVTYLLELLGRTPEQITLGVMALARSFTPEMRRALELLQMKRRMASKKKDVVKRAQLRGTPSALTKISQLAAGISYAGNGVTGAKRAN